ncbi:MAG: transglutaminase domain-containing protein [Eubacteriales bacterium]|nr:transglutaminase domain-containing protein [Eubacteriales bacterium]
MKYSRVTRRAIAVVLAGIMVTSSLCIVGCNNKTEVAEELTETAESVTDEAVHTQQATEPTTVKVHQNPPVIYGVEDKTYYVGAKPSYMSGVYAVDDTEQEIDVEIDKSQVDTSTPGSYNVYYKAVDSEGNETTVEAVFSFIEEVTQAANKYATLDDVVSAVLSQITNSSMSKGEKTRVIYNYVHGKIGYSANNYGAVDWQSEAYNALIDLDKYGFIYGDCFTYCSVARALLLGMGAECIWVNNKGAATGDHSWLLCNVGTGWYHFDATRMHDKFECYMLTDEQIQDYLDKGNSVYKRDMSLYPATPSEHFSY